MPSGAALRAKVKAVLKQLQATPRVVKLRNTRYVGGNPLLGIGGVEIITLIEVDPQPAVESLMLPAIARSEDIASANALLQPGDYLFTFDGTVSEDSLRTTQILYGDEILSIIRVDPVAMGGVIVVYSVLARTVQSRL